jgi:hypothetical protein
VTGVGGDVSVSASSAAAAASLSGDASAVVSAAAVPTGRQLKRRLGTGL